MRHNFDVSKVCHDVIQWIRDYFDKQPSAKGAIIGISGGKDSTVVAKLLVEALGKERVYGVLMPNGEQKDIEDSMRVVTLLDIDYRTVNIEEAYKGLISSLGNDMTYQALVNIPPRLRMTTLYAIGASLDYRVCGTGNKSEAFVGYSTKWGDGAHDFNPIGDLTTEEVVAIGDHLGLPMDLTHKAPSDGLTGKTDEDNLGVTYNQINLYMETGTTGNPLADKTIAQKHEINKHKKEPIPVFRSL